MAINEYIFTIFFCVINIINLLQWSWDTFWVVHTKFDGNLYCWHSNGQFWKAIKDVLYIDDFGPLIIKFSNFKCLNIKSEIENNTAVWDLKLISKMGNSFGIELPHAKYYILSLSFCYRKKNCGCVFNYAIWNGVLYLIPFGQPKKPPNLLGIF